MNVAVQPCTSRTYAPSPASVLAAAAAADDAPRRTRHRLLGSRNAADDG